MLDSWRSNPAAAAAAAVNSGGGGTTVEGRPLRGSRLSDRRLSGEQDRRSSQPTRTGVMLSGRYGRGRLAGARARLIVLHSFSINVDEETAHCHRIRKPLRLALRKDSERSNDRGAEEALSSMICDGKPLSRALT